MYKESEKGLKKTKEFFFLNFFTEFSRRRVNRMSRNEVTNSVFYDIQWGHPETVFQAEKDK